MQQAMVPEETQENSDTSSKGETHESLYKESLRVGRSGHAVFNRSFASSSCEMIEAKIAVHRNNL